MDIPDVCKQYNPLHLLQQKWYCSSISWHSSQLSGISITNTALLIYLFLSIHHHRQSQNIFLLISHSVLQHSVNYYKLVSVCILCCIHCTLSHLHTRYGKHHFVMPYIFYRSYLLLPSLNHIHHQGCSCHKSHTTYPRCDSLNIIIYTFITITILFAIDNLDATINYNTLQQPHIPVWLVCRWLL